MGFGEYPVQYDRAKHGPYDPARYYGKPDTPFGEVKIKDFYNWFGRRDKSPTAMAQLVSRAYWRWQHKYIFPERAGIAPFLQLGVGLSIIFYWLNYKRISAHKNYKYH